MALVKCNECNGDVSTEAAACPHCGAKTPKPKSDTKTIVWAIVAVPIAAFVLAAASGPKDPLAEVKSADRSAISNCWDIYERKSLNPFEKAGWARQCEGMEANYKSKYGVSP